jgi:hypothetical protein
VSQELCNLLLIPNIHSMLPENINVPPFLFMTADCMSASDQITETQRDTLLVN